MRSKLIIIAGIMITLMACASPEVSRLGDEGEGGSAEGLVQAGCGKYIVPTVTEAYGIDATGFGYPVESVTLEGMDCFRDGSLALNAFTEHNQVVVNGTPVKLFVRDNNLVAVANDTIVGQKPLQEEQYGKELAPTGRFVVAVDDLTIGAENGPLTWAL